MVSVTIPALPCENSTLLQWPSHLYHLGRVRSVGTLL